MNSSENQDLKTRIEEQQKEIQQLKLQLESEKKLSSNTAKDVQDFYEDILALMPGHIYWLDKNNVFLGCNDIQAKNAGLNSRKEIVGKTNFDMPWKDQAEELNKLNNKVMETGLPHIAEEYAVMADGTTVYLSNKSPLRDKNNAIVGILGVSIDITERKKMEVALKRAKENAEMANQIKAEFIANLSHDLQTPLNGIVDMAKLLKTQAGSDEARQSAEWIYQSGNQLLKLVAGIFDMIKENTLNENTAYIQHFDLEQCIKDIEQLLRPSLQLKQISLDKVVDSNIPRHLLTDDSKLHRILLNLIGNAVRISEQGKVGLEIRLLAEDPASVRLGFTITSSEAELPSDANESNIALKIAEKYLGLLGAEMTITNAGDAGMSFCFTLSLKKAI